MKEKERKGNRYIKTLKFTYAEVDMIDHCVAEVVDYIAEKGGKIISILQPTIFGYKPALLVISIVYEAEQRISGFPVFKPEKKQVMFNEEET